MSWRPASRRSPAHPRSRGENHGEARGRLRARGSSPLTRGKRRPEQVVDLKGRLIPAHAGKTRRATKREARSRAHPRSRGENTYCLQSDQLFRGSSPLTRGKRLFQVGGSAHGRLIPAHAGKTAITSAYKHSVAAHPRSRGENVMVAGAARADAGSSPLTRGKRRWSMPRGPIDGLIPAHAGKTVQCGRIGGGGGAHPRSRGENPSLRTPPIPESGSSPLTRGKLVLASDGETELGLIPAHAGKTGYPAFAAPGLWAHPRSRGENL